MKKLLIAIALISVLLLAWFVMRDATHSVTENPVISKKNSIQSGDGLATHSPGKSVAPAGEMQSSKSPGAMSVDVFKLESLSSWTNAIPNFKEWSHFRERSSWVADEVDSNSYPVVLLSGREGNRMPFVVKLASVDAMDEEVQKVELHTPNMDIEETRKFGLKLCAMQGVDPYAFLAWCDKAASGSLDIPQYDGVSLKTPNGEKYYGFGVLRTFNNEKPWYINFFILKP